MHDSSWLRTILFGAEKTMKFFVNLIRSSPKCRLLPRTIFPRHPSSKFILTASCTTTTAFSWVYNFLYLFLLKSRILNLLFLIFRGLFPCFHINLVHVIKLVMLCTETLRNFAFKLILLRLEDIRIKYIRLQCYPRMILVLLAKKRISLL